MSIEIEGIVSSVDGARELDQKGMMSLHLTLRPWRRHDSRDNELGTAIVTVFSDLDYVDAWMNGLDPGKCLRVMCTSVSGADENGNVTVEAHGEPLRPCPDEWSGASN